MYGVARINGETTVCARSARRGVKCAQASARAVYARSATEAVYARSEFVWACSGILA
jgi:hypothetical protein